MADSIFIADGERFVPTEHARGPWDPRTLHGGAPAALIAAAFERMQPGAELCIARLGFEFLRPVPRAPLMLSTRIVRPGRRVQELAAELSAPAAETEDSLREGARGATASGAEVICRASALRVAPIAPAVPTSPAGGDALAPPLSGEPVRFALDGSDAASFATTAMEMRWLSDSRQLGPGRVWMRLRRPLLADDPPTPFTHLAAAADFGNGISAELPFDEFVFINADLTIHVTRPPRGTWIGLDAHTHLRAGGVGLAESVLHDEHGPLGRAFQTLVVQSR